MSIIACLQQSPVSELELEWVPSEISLDKSWRRLTSILFVALMLFTSRDAAAQLVATKDLTKPPITTTSPPPTPLEAKPATPLPNGTEDRHCFQGVSDGVIVPDVPEKLQLEIVNTDPRLVYDGTTMVVTVRLKNVGDQHVLVPWETHPIEPDVDPNDGTTSYESATVHLTFGTLGDRQASYLKGQATLVAAPNNRAQHVELLSGQWVDVKLRSVIECASKEPWACKPFRADKNARLTADWSEWLYTRGCKEGNSAYKSRTLESAPVEVVYVASAPSDKETSVPPR
jgi:hypothetical protein